MLLPTPQFFPGRVAGIEETMEENRMPWEMTEKNENGRVSSREMEEVRSSRRFSYNEERCPHTNNNVILRGNVE